MSLDREIEELVAVDPSPEFLAKVRQRIGTEPAPSSWWLSWQPATVGVGLAAVVTAALWWPSAAPVAPRGNKPIAPAIDRASASASEAGTAPVASTLAAATAPVETPSRRRASAVPNRFASSAVLIQRDEAKAMNLLLARVREGALPDMADALAAADATGPQWIAILPVVIEPIATGEGE